ncbi:Tyrosine-protein kinase, partial [Parasponia andersonii]
MDDVIELPLFDMAAITIATNNFSPANILGASGFGPVCRGAKEFKNEVNLIAELQHKNLVALFSCCIQGDEKMGSQSRQYSTAYQYDSKDFGVWLSKDIRSGYMSPDYAVNGTFSVKSDVFSFGVLLLEIVSGKQNRGFSHPNHRQSLLGHESGVIYLPESTFLSEY